MSNNNSIIATAGASVDMSDSDDLQFVDGLEMDCSEAALTSDETNSHKPNAKEPLGNPSTSITDTTTAYYAQKTLPTHDLVASAAPVAFNHDEKPSSHRPAEAAATISQELQYPTKVSSLFTIKHFIDGFIIEESSTPFPVTRSSLLTDAQQLQTRKKVTRRRTVGCTGTAGSQVSSRAQSPIVTVVQNISAVEKNVSYSDYADGISTSQGLDVFCVHCQRKCTPALVRFYRNEAFCSKSCIHKKRRVVLSQPGASPPKRGRPFGSVTRNKPAQRNSCGSIIGGLSSVVYSHPSRASKGTYRAVSIKDEPFDTTISSDMVPQDPQMYGVGDDYDSEDSLLFGSETIECYKRIDVMSWTISDVRDFVLTLAGCEQYAADFEEQEIDGRALLLLNEDHLLHALDIKLGPTLKIIEQINTFR